MNYGRQRSLVRFFIVFLTVVALAALYFGLAIFNSFVFDYLWNSHVAQRWPQVQAKVLNVDWVWFQARSRTGGFIGKDMRVIVRYEYTYGKGTYQSDRVGFEPFAARNKELYRTLQEAKLRKRSLIAWVNPEQPSEAVLDYQISWIAIVFYFLTATLLTGIGGGLLYLLGRAGWPD